MRFASSVTRIPSSWRSSEVPCGLRGLALMRLPLHVHVLVAVKGKRNVAFQGVATGRMPHLVRIFSQGLTGKGLLQGQADPP